MTLSLLLDEGAASRLSLRRIGRSALRTCRARGTGDKRHGNVFNVLGPAEATVMGASVGSRGGRESNCLGDVAMRIIRHGLAAMKSLWLHLAGEKFPMPLCARNELRLGEPRTRWRG